MRNTLRVTAGLLLVLALTACGTAPEAPVPSSADTVSVTYRLTGDAPRVDIMVATSTGDDSQSDVMLPLQDSSGNEGLTASVLPGKTAYIIAEAKQDAVLVCSIEAEDGTVLVTRTLTADDRGTLVCETQVPKT